MSDEMTTEKQRASAWFRSLRDQIVSAFEALEDTQLSGTLRWAPRRPVRGDRDGTRVGRRV